jgi:hypothetical protein
MAFNSNAITPAQFKKTVGLRAVLAHFGSAVEGDRCLCPFHDDHTSSMFVNDEFAYCFACGQGWDIFDFVAEKLTRQGQETDFSAAWDWLYEHRESLLPSGEVKSRRTQYRGPVHRDLIEYWHSCLTAEHRQDLYVKRLLTDETIDLHCLGWRPDWEAYAIPFWSGIPQKSEIETVQFRMTRLPAETIARFSSDRKFIGLPGHTRPALINVHTLTDWGIMVFGTFDALLCAQDGFPCVSPNGSSAFSGKAQKKRLQTLLQSIKLLFVVYDNTVSELASAKQTVADLPCEIIERQFIEHKDYGDYRLEKSKEDFVREILKWSLT